MRSISTAIVTGATGAIGTALCRNLKNNNITVYAVCRKNSIRIAKLPDGISVIECDLDNIKSLKDKIPNGADAFFHFAWADTIGDGRNDMYSQTKNIAYSLDAMNVAKMLGCQVFIGSGSQAEYGRVDSVIDENTPCNPENGYGIAKLCTGKMGKIECKKLGIDFIWTRILSVYGPNDSSRTMISTVISKLLKKEKPSLTAGNQLWDYIYSEDIAQAFRLLALKGKSGKTYVVANGNSRPLKEYVEIIRDTIDSRLELGFGEIKTDAVPLSLQADISELKKDTGFEPIVSFKDGIAKTIESKKTTEL